MCKYASLKSIRVRWPVRCCCVGMATQDEFVSRVAKRSRLSANAQSYLYQVALVSAPNCPAIYCKSFFGKVGGK